MSALEKFFELPADITLWGILNSQILTTLMSASVAIVLARYGKRTADAAAESAAAQNAVSATQQAAQIEKAVEADQAAESDQAGLAVGQQAIPDPPPQPGEKDWKMESRALVEEAKGVLEARAERDPDGRHRRTYEAINRYDYLALAVALNVRGQLSPQQIAAATTIFTTWRSFNTGRAARRPVPSTVYKVLQRCLEILKNGK